jgi:hypothetical protein
MQPELSMVSDTIDLHRIKKSPPFGGLSALRGVRQLVAFGWTKKEPRGRGVLKGVQ